MKTDDLKREALLIFRYEEAEGDSNRTRTVIATAEGLQFEEGGECLPWDWIFEARQKLESHGPSVLVQNHGPSRPTKQ